MPFDPIEVDDLSPAARIRRLRPRRIAGKFGVGHTTARYPFIRDEAIRSGTDGFADLRCRICFCDPLRHDEQHIEGLLTERLVELRERLLEAEAATPIVDDAQLV